MTIYLFYKVEITLLSIKKVLKNILAKYLNVVNVFSKKFTLELLDYLSINEYIIKLKISR